MSNSGLSPAAPIGERKPLHIKPVSDIHVQAGPYKLGVSDRMLQPSIEPVVANSSLPSGDWGLCTPFSP